MLKSASTLLSIRFERFAKHERGQDLMEYGLLASLIATFLIGALGMVGEQVDAIWQVIAGIQYGQ